jgi:FlaA1/EpsC-like NDP-sugar epimerase
VLIINLHEKNFTVPSFMKRKLIDQLFSTYESLSRNQKRWLLVFADFFVLATALFLAFTIRIRSVSGAVPFVASSWPAFLACIVITLCIFKLTGIYRPILRYTGLEFLSAITKATLISSGLWLLLSLRIDMWWMPKSVIIINALLTLVLVVAARLLIRYFINSIYRQLPNNPQAESVIIYGAGSAGMQLADNLKHEPGYVVAAFVDDNAELHNNLMGGHHIYAPHQLAELIEVTGAKTLVMAIPSISKANRKKVIDRLQYLPITIKTVPTLTEILTNKVSLSAIRRVEVSDLLGREEVMPEPELLTLNITDKSVLVTGAGGSIGAELCRQIAKLEPVCLVLYELSEFALYSIDMELRRQYPHIPCYAYLGNVTDRSHLSNVLIEHQVETVYHAAAYKHVPLVEANPAQGVRNNVLGTLNTAQCAIDAQVQNFVLISTDKAVRPTNIMGASKRCAELTIQALADLPNCNTRFGIVRFGNVLDSSGSVVPHFRQQIASGQPITVTHPEVTRYFMSIPEAVRLVIQAGAMATGGDVFLLEMGDPVKIYDLAEQMIRLSGLTPGKDIEIKITGLRPGEKLYEELLIDGDNIQPTHHPKIFSAYEEKFSWKELEPMLQVLFQAAQAGDKIGIVRQLQRLVAGYQPDSRLLQQIEKNSPIDKPVKKEREGDKSGNLEASAV